MRVDGLLGGSGVQLLCALVGRSGLMRRLLRWWGWALCAAEFDAGWWGWWSGWYEWWWGMGGRFCLTRSVSCGLRMRCGCCGDRSIVWALHGSDPIEACALGKAVLCGPRMGDFAQSAGVLEGAGALRRVGADGLSAAIAGLLGDAGARKVMGEAGAGCVESQRGASARNAGLVLGLLRGERAEGVVAVGAGGVGDLGGGV